MAFVNFRKLCKYVQNMNCYIQSTLDQKIKLLITAEPRLNTREDEHNELYTADC